MEQPQRALLAAAQDVALHSDGVVDSVMPIAPAEVAHRLPQPALHCQPIQGMAVTRLLEGPISCEQARSMGAFATAVAVDAPGRCRSSSVWLKGQWLGLLARPCWHAGRGRGRRRRVSHCAIGRAGSADHSSRELS
jgi:hypothetical protein